MSTPASSASPGYDTGLHGDSPEEMARPYPGGRAQAESGSRIIENDYSAWKTITGAPGRLSPDYPLVQPLTRAWHAVSMRGLGDDAAAASIRYRVLAHAARSLIPVAAEVGHGREAGTLQTLWEHALIHGHRLYATGLDRFIRSSASDRYTGFAQAAVESSVVGNYYLAWEQIPAARLAETEPSLAGNAALLGRSWASIEQLDLTDGPGPAAERYRALAGHARVLSEDIAQRLPSEALIPLLELAVHADKHAIRLLNTAVAIKGEAAVRPAPYRGLPVPVAAAAAQAHAGVPHAIPNLALPEEGVIAQAARNRAAQKQREPRE
jgi:hypothetical protein